jgi:hypothetical protein
MKTLIRRGTKPVRRGSGRPRAFDSSEVLRDARVWLRGAGARASEATSRAYRRARSFSYESPGTLALVALGAGVGIGVFCGRRLSRPAGRQGLLSSLAAVVAQAVSDRRG